MTIENKDDLRFLPIPQKLQWLRDKYSDEIPVEMISSLSPNRAFKARKGWFQSLIGVLGYAINRGFITRPEVLEEARVFFDRYTSEEFKRQPRITADDIAQANEIINRIIGDGIGCEK